jgi:hypothetical protein
MMAALGGLLAVVGLFLFLWYRTAAALPARRQPAFLRLSRFKWGLPALSLLLFGSGAALLAGVSLAAAAATAAMAVLLGWITVHFNRYSAEMRLILGRYRRIHEANPSLDESQTLFLTAKWRYPDWSQDRILELVAGKDIEGLILLILLRDYEINPISDWELYRDLKARAARMAGAPT